MPDPEAPPAWRRGCAVNQQRVPADQVVLNTSCLMAYEVNFQPGIACSSARWARNPVIAADALFVACFHFGSLSYKKATLKTLSIHLSST
ncbi:hypothetical protein D3C77_498190 [compost metagenome]